ncbi:YqiA/YcfP family alpha/beta fold hydrolase [Paludibacterium yongneupense]|uniref:YqiA/YcfP family alpha/beta fold hydrolase n=1 Tax=Paludibacterium yongneupense TaxID=400061 RepID=UPI0006847AA0|nr:YqiA/YcfP family alpha/beta fold hydrolase [Paludibacterium yongneupense]
MSPDLNFVYLHGFNSSPGSAKALETAAFLAPGTLHCPALPPHPADALRVAREVVENLPADTVIIGSSLGGFYASWLAAALDRRAVLINPTLFPHIELARFMGEQIQPFTGERYTLGRDDGAVLAEHVVARPSLRRYWLVLGTADETLDWRLAARHYSGCRQTLLNGDNHRLQRWPECLPGLRQFVQDTTHTALTSSREPSR